MKVHVNALGGQDAFRFVDVICSSINFQRKLLINVIIRNLDVSEYRGIAESNMADSTSVRKVFLRTSQTNGRIRHFVIRSCSMGSSVVASYNSATYGSMFDKARICAWRNK